jgi:hypothetical protein
MSRGVQIFLALAWLAASGPALADDAVEQARARFRRGVDLYRQQRWREAAKEFEAAYQVKPHGAIHFNVAQCRERLEEWPAAFRAYADYLREVPDAEDRATVRAAMRKIEDRLAKVGTQVLLVYGVPPGALVTLDGVERGQAPLHLVLPPGAYALRLTLDGHEPAAERVTLAASASTIVELTLERAATPVPAEQTGAGHGPGDAGNGPASGPASGAGHGPGHGPDLAARPPAEPVRPYAAPLSAAPAAPKTRMLPVWIAGGAAVAAAAAGVWFGASARSDERALAGMTTPDGALASQLAQSAQAKARTANWLYAIAGGAAVAAGTLYVIEARF